MNGLVLLLLLLLAIYDWVSPCYARISFKSQSPTFPESTHATPYIGFHIAPDDPLSLTYTEIVRFQPADGSPVDVYEVTGPVPYVEYDMTAKGYTPRHIRMEQSTTFSADTLGMEAEHKLPDASVEVVKPRTFVTMKHARQTDDNNDDGDGWERDGYRGGKKVNRQVKNFVRKRMHPPTARRLTELGEGVDWSSAVEGSYMETCLAQSSKPDQVTECMKGQTERAHNVSATLSVQSRQLMQMKNFALRLTKSFGTLNSTFASMYETLLAQLAVDQDQTDSIQVLIASFEQTIREEEAAKDALAKTQAAADLHVAYGTNVTGMAANMIKELSNNAVLNIVAEQFERNAITETFNVLLQMTTTSDAQLAFQSQQLTFSSSVIRSLANIMLAMLRNDQTRADEILQQNRGFTAAQRDGWVPWVFNYGQAPLEYLPTAWQVETLGYMDFYWVRGGDTGPQTIVRDHITLLCDVQRLVQNFQNQQVSTFLDLFSLFSTETCFGADCNCRVHRTRHTYVGADATKIVHDDAYGIGNPTHAPTDTYAVALRNWLWTGNWTSDVARERVAVPARGDCSTTIFSPFVDPYHCVDARAMDHTTPVAQFTVANKTAALSTGRWRYEEDTWFTTTGEVTRLLQDQCQTRLSPRFPLQQSIAMNAFAWQMDMPEAPETRSYCNPAFDTILTSMSIGRPFMYITMQHLVKYFRAWREIRASSLQTLLDGYAASPQVTDSQPFHYELIANGTIPALLQAHHMYSVSVSPDAEVVWTFNNRRDVQHLTMRRLKVDPLDPAYNTNDRYDLSFDPVRLGTTMLHDTPSVSQLDALPGAMKWVGYPKCLYEACPFKVLNLTRTNANPTNPVGRVNSVAALRGANDQTFVGTAYVLDTTDSRTLTTTVEGALRYSDTYGYMPMPTMATTAGVVANELIADGIDTRYMSPTLYEWTQAHQGKMDPRHVGTGVGAYAVTVESHGGNPFNIRCASTRGAVSDKCTWLDKFYTDMDATRGTVRFYARNWRLDGLLPMPDQGNILLSVTTSCPEDVQVHAQVMQQTSIELTNHVFKPNQYVYIVSTRCDIATHSFFTGEHSTTQGTVLDVIIGQAWMEALYGTTTTTTKPPVHVTVQERSMDAWIPYQTHTATMAGCNGQTVHVFASDERFAVDAYLTAYMQTIPFVAGDTETWSPTLGDDQYAWILEHGRGRAALVHAKATELVRAVIAKSTQTFVALGDSSTTIVPFARCLRWQAGETIVLARDVESSVVTQVQYTSDQISRAFRSVQEQLSFAMSQSFTVTENIISNVFQGVAVSNMDALRIAVESANAENIAAQARLREIVLRANNNERANRIIVDREADELDALLVPPETIRAMLDELQVVADMRKAVLAEEERLLGEYYVLMGNFSGMLASIQDTNYAFDPPPDVGGINLGRILSITSMSPCPLKVLDEFDSNRYVYNSGGWLGGKMLPLRYWFITTLIMVIAWVYVQYLPVYASKRVWQPVDNGIGENPNRRWMERRTGWCCGDWMYPEPDEEVEVEVLSPL